MKKKKLLVILGVCVVVGIGIILLAVSMISRAEINQLISENEHYEAYKRISKNGAQLESYDSPGVMFFDVMAHHYENDIVGKDTWVLPDFTGWSCAEIAYALKNIGQAYEIEYVKDDRANANIVVEQFPRCGNEAIKSDAITLNVNTYFAIDNIYSMIKTRSKQVTEIGEWIYYTTDESIYRSRIDGKERTKIYDNNDETKNIISIIGNQEKLYCFISEKMEFDYTNIVAISLSDYSSKLIGEFDYTSMKNYVFDDNLVIRTPDVYYINTKNDEQSFISEGYFDFIVYDDSLYYVVEEEQDGGLIDKLVRSKIDDTSNREELIDEEGRIAYFCIKDDVIYYMNYQKNVEDYSSFLMQYDIKSGETRELSFLIKDLVLSVRAFDLNLWRDNLLLAQIDGESFMYNIETAQITKYQTPELFDEKYFSELYTVCGNYAWYREIIRGNLIEPEFSIVRVNLMTLEREDFIVE